MHDIKAIRDDPEAFDRAWASRGLGAQTPELLRFDEQLRGAQTALQAAQNRRNEASKLIGQAKAKKDEATASALMAEVEASSSARPPSPCPATPPSRSTRNARSTFRRSRFQRI